MSIPKVLKLEHIESALREAYYNSIVGLIRVQESKLRIKLMDYVTTDQNNCCIMVSVFTPHPTWEIDLERFWTDLININLAISSTKASGGLVLDVTGILALINGNYKKSVRFHIESYKLTGDLDSYALAFNAMGTANMSIKNYRYSIDLQEQKRFLDSSFSGAIQNFDAAIGMCCIDQYKSIFNSNKTRAFYLWGQSLSDLGFYREGVQKFQEAYRLSKDIKYHLYAVRVEALILAHKQKYEDSIILLDWCLSCECSDQDVKLMLVFDKGYVFKLWGASYCVRGAFKKAASKYKIAYDLTQELACKISYLYARAEYMVSKKKYNDALEEYNWAIEVAGDSCCDKSSLYYNKARILRALRKKIQENHEPSRQPNSFILNQAKKAKIDFSYAQLSDKDMFNAENHLAETLCNLEQILYYFPDLDDYATLASDIKDLLSDDYGP